VDAVIDIQNLSRSYGARQAIKDLSLQIGKGEIFGFVGPNGAGKTTTLRIMATLLAPTSGEVWIAGNSVIRQPRQVRGVIGYMPDFFGVYKGLKVWEYLDFFAACYDIPEAQRPPLIEDLLDLVDLSHRRDDWVDQLSQGLKQRLSLARTLVHDPQVLILDEPASGLDPRARVEIREILRALAKMGKSIFFSTHILSDVAEIADRVGIIEAGELVAVGELEELQNHLLPQRRVEMIVLDGQETAQALLSECPQVSNLQYNHQPPPDQVPKGENGRQALAFEFRGDDRALSDLLTSLIEQGIPVVHFSENRRDLEEVFLRATKGLVT
jgi:ABC-2 type transport system ATP-binding protein